MLGLVEERMLVVGWESFATGLAGYDYGNMGHGMDMI